MDQKISAETPPIAMWGGFPIPVLALTMCAGATVAAVALAAAVFGALRDRR